MRFDEQEVGTMIVLDAEYDARVAGLCTCQRCLDAYIRAFRHEAARMGVQVRLGSYHGTPPDGATVLWQAIHDRTDWEAISSRCHRRGVRKMKR